MKPAHSHRNARNIGIRSNRGTTMIEVLVAIVIIAIGLLGYAGLLLKSNKDNLTAYQRTQATLLAYDIIDSMRVNRSNAGSYTTALESAAPGDDGTIAAKDLIRWKDRIAAALPNGKGSILIGGTEVTVTIEWSNTSRIHDGEYENTTLTTQSRI